MGSYISPLNSKCIKHLDWVMVRGAVVGEPVSCKFPAKCKFSCMGAGIRSGGEGHPLVCTLCGSQFPGF